MPKAVAIVSGGLDSVTLTYDLQEQGYDVTVLSFNYGQRHKKELEFAKIAAEKNGFDHHIIDLSSITSLISNSALTSDEEIEVPEGHYAEESMKATVVPNRNMMMLSIAGAVAVNEGAQFVATAVHGGDHFIYPDCRPLFVAAAAEALEVGNEGFSNFRYSTPDRGSYGAIYAPYIHRDKTYIALRAFEMRLQFEESWSCYAGGEIHCGRCGTCVERLEAIHDAGATEWDNTKYADEDFWRTQVGK